MLIKHLLPKPPLKSQRRQISAKQSPFLFRGHFLKVYMCLYVSLLMFSLIIFSQKGPVCKGVVILFAKG